MKGLDKAISMFDTQTGLANALGVNPMVVHQWTKRGVPPNRAKEIERVTGGKVTRADIRPDIFA